MANSSYKDKIQEAFKGYLHEFNINDKLGFEDKFIDEVVHELGLTDSLTYKSRIGFYKQRIAQLEEDFGKVKEENGV